MTDDERIQLAAETAKKFLAAETIAEKAALILDPAVNSESLAEFHTYEPLAPAVPPTVRHRVQRELVDERPLQITFPLKSRT